MPMIAATRPSIYIGFGEEEVKGRITCDLAQPGETRGRHRACPDLPPLTREASFCWQHREATIPGRDTCTYSYLGCESYEIAASPS